MTQPTLAKHQKEGAELVLNDYKEGVKNTLICSSTGSGKTVVFSYLIYLFIKMGLKILVLTDRSSILNQAGGSSTNLYGVKPEYITANGRFPNPSSSLFIGMVATVFNRIDKPQYKTYQHLLKKIDVIIIDECHEHIFYKVFAHDLFKDKFRVGFTATPIYSGKKNQIKDDYEKIHVIANEQEMIDAGMNCDHITIWPQTGMNIKDVKIKSTGEYQDQGLIDMQNLYIGFEMMVEQYRKGCEIFLNDVRNNNPKLYLETYANDRNLKGLYFGVNGKNVIDICAAFNAAGIPSKYILSNTKIQSKKERLEIEKQFANNEFKILVNCGIFTKGFDSPDSIVIGKMYRTTSIAKDNQVGGRGARPVTDKPLYTLKTAAERKEVIRLSRKPYFVIIDYMGNCDTHFEWCDPIDWEGIFLDGLPPKTDNIGVQKECPECGNMVAASSKICGTLVCDEKGVVFKCPHEFEVNLSPKFKDKFKGEYGIVLRWHKKTNAELKEAIEDDKLSLSEALTAANKKAKGNVLNMMDEVNIKPRDYENTLIALGIKIRISSLVSKRNKLVRKSFDKHITLYMDNFKTTLTVNREESIKKASNKFDLMRANLGFWEAYKVAMKGMGFELEY